MIHAALWILAACIVVPFVIFIGTLVLGGGAAVAGSIPKDTRKELRFFFWLCLIGFLIRVLFFG